MDGRQESKKRRLKLGTHERLFLVATIFAFFAWVATTETGPEPVDFYCTSLAAARGAGDDETRIALVGAGHCKSFLTDHGFQAYGESTVVEEIEGTQYTIWLVDFSNSIQVYTVR